MLTKFKNFNTDKFQFLTKLKKSFGNNNLTPFEIYTILHRRNLWANNGMLDVLITLNMLSRYKVSILKWEWFDKYFWKVVKRTIL